MSVSPRRPGVAKAGTLVMLALAAGCASSGATADAPDPNDAPVVRPGAPGDTTRVVDPDDLGAVDSYVPSDVAFMQGMIRHHAQALAMSALVEERTRRSEIGMLARRVTLSQVDEIGFMTGWLEGRGEALPPQAAPGADSHALHDPSAELMPGMLSAEEMERLAAATGDEFDRLFLAAMILHHEGALRMVEELFSDPRAGREDEIAQFATHVASDQTIEIARMQRMLDSLMAVRP